MARKYSKYPRLELIGDTFYAFYRDANNVRQRQSLKTRNQNIAITRYSKILKEVEQGVLGFSLKPKRLPFDELAEQYLQEGTADLATLSRLRSKQAIKNHLKPHFRKESMARIDARAILRFLDKRLAAGAAPHTIQKEINALSAIFRFLVERGIVSHNPVLGVRKPKLKQVRPNYVPTENEVYAILQHINPACRRFLLALCNTGCRMQEMTSVKVADVDLDARTIRVKRKGARIGFLPINDVLLEAIREEFAERKWRASDPLFVSRYGSGVKTIRASLRTACTAAGVSYCTHHSFRHAYATILKDRGVDIGTISKLLGHASPTVTQNIYIHWRDQEALNAGLAVQIGKKMAKSQSEPKVNSETEAVSA